jgi:hypothetical protein
VSDGLAALCIVLLGVWVYWSIDAFEGNGVMRRPTIEERMDLERSFVSLKK